MWDTYPPDGVGRFVAEMSWPPRLMESGALSWTTIHRETMRCMSTDRWRRVRWSPLLVAIGLGLSACTANGDPSDAPPPTVIVTTTVTHSPASMASTAVPSPDTSVNVAATESAVENLQQVDPELYFGTDPGRDDGYFFESPSGNLSCGILVNRLFTDRSGSGV